MPERWVVVASPVTPSRGDVGRPKIKYTDAAKPPPIVPNYENMAPIERIHQKHNKSRSSIFSESSFTSSGSAASFLESSAGSSASSASSIAATSVSSEYAYDTLDKEIAKSYQNQPSLGKSQALAFALRGCEDIEKKKREASGIKEGSIMERIELKHRRKQELDYMKKEESRRRKQQAEREKSQPENFFKDDYKRPISSLPKATKQEKKAASVMEQLADFVTRPGAMEGNTEGFELRPHPPRPPRTADIGSKSVGGRVVLHKGGTGTYDLITKSNFYDRAREIAVFPRARKDESEDGVSSSKKGKVADLPISMKSKLAEDQLVVVKLSVAEFVMRGYESEESRIIAKELEEQEEKSDKDYLEWKRQEVKKSLGDKLKPSYKSTTKLHFDEKEKTLARSFIYNSRGRPRREESIAEDGSIISANKVYSRWGDTRHGSTADICESLSKLRYRAEKVQNDINDLNSEDGKKKLKKKLLSAASSNPSSRSHHGTSSIDEKGEFEEVGVQEVAAATTPTTKQQQLRGLKYLMSSKNDGKGENETFNEDFKEESEKVSREGSLSGSFNRDHMTNKKNKNQLNQKTNKNQQAMATYEKGSVWDPTIAVCGRVGCEGCRNHHLKSSNTPGPSTYCIPTSTSGEAIKGGRISRGYPKSYIDWIEYHEKQKPGPCDHPYLAPTNIKGNASFSASKSVTELERIMRESSKKPGPVDHPGTQAAFIATKYASPAAKFAF